MKRDKMDIMEIFQRSFGWIGGGLKVCYYIYQVAPFIRVIKGKLNYKDTPVIHALICYINCLFWYDYGEFMKKYEIKIWNLINTYIFFALIAIYLIYERKEYSEDSLYNAIIFTTGSWILSLELSLFSNRKIEIILMISTIIEYASLIKFVYRAKKEKNYNLIKINSIKFNLLSCLFWIIYGVFLRTYIIFPNSIGIIVSSALIWVHSKHRKTYSSEEKEAASSILANKTEKDESKNKIDFDDRKLDPIKLINRLRNKNNLKIKI